VDAASFRHVIGHFASGVAVITTRHDGRAHGMTASAVCSLSLEPPMLLACASRRSPTQAAILATGSFAVNILRERQHAIATRFAGPHEDKFEGIAQHAGRLGTPLLSDALARIECDVVDTLVGGTHRVFLGAVRHAEVDDGSPLAYYRGRFGRLDLAADEDALMRLRRIVLSREHPLAEPLRTDVLSTALGVDAASVHYGLTRLVAEGLVERTPEGYRQVALDASASDEALEAKLAIDLAAARLALARAGDAELAGLTELAESIPPAERGEAHVNAVEAFHERMIALAGNTALLRAYRQVSLADISRRVLATDAAALDRLTVDHLAIARALARRDARAVEVLVNEHSERARGLHRETIARAGGRI
jgi:4-nitrophenol 2-monooxygenase / 4-nitrocatechol 4-monooxygenase, reductase component